MEVNLYNKSLVEKVQLYALMMNPVLDRESLYADCTEEYVKPAEPMEGDEVTIYLRVGRNNPEHVYLLTDEQKIEMQYDHSEGLFDFYYAKVTMGKRPFHYCFEVVTGCMNCYYNQRGVMLERQDYYNFKLVPGLKTPDWAKGAVIYQIFVDRFYNGDKANDPLDREYSYIGEGIRQIKDWDKYPDAMDVRSFYGGDLQGVMDKLDYLQGLGIDVIYFNPLFVSPSNHKYDIQDYDYIDPHFGRIVKDEGETLIEWDNSNSHASRYICRVTNKENLEASNQLFIELVEEVHRRGMKVIIDGVFNHCGSFNKWLDRECIYQNQEGYEAGAYISEDSPYHDYFSFHDRFRFPYNDSYDGWWGHDTLPKLNYEASPQLVEEILRIARKWVSPPFNADGWRLDVAADLGHSSEYNHFFWRKFREAVKEANPNAIILAEHYGDPCSWLEGGEWDTVMNYDAFMEPITWFLTGMEKHSDEYRGDLLGNARSFFDAMSHHMSRFTSQSMMVAMNELSNHDHSRFLTRTNHRVGRTAYAGPEAASEGINVAVFRSAVVIQMTWVGAPTIYYGDEAGVCGWTDPDNRRTYPWGKEDLELIEFHRQIIQIHKENPALMKGSYHPLIIGNQCLAYGRFKGTNRIAVAVNNSKEEVTLFVPVWKLGVGQNSVMEVLMHSTFDGYSCQGEGYIVKNNMIKVVLGAFSSLVVREKQ